MLETRRLKIRAFSFRDLKDILEYLSDPEVQIPAGGSPISTIEEAQKILDKYMSREDIYAIELKEEGKVIGAIGAYNLTYNNILERHLGFEITRKYWNQGYLTEAAKELINYLFTVENMDRIAISNYPFNKASIRVAEKLGFVKEGILRKEDRLTTGELVDRIVYSIIKEEYRGV
jgi:RimJ/RimL family protein N-acetyltransferase